MSYVSCVVFLNKFFSLNQVDRDPRRSQSFIFELGFERLDVAFGCFQYLVPQYDILSVL